MHNHIHLAIRCFSMSRMAKTSESVKGVARRGPGSTGFSIFSSVLKLIR